MLLMVERGRGEPGTGGDGMGGVAEVLAAVEDGCSSSAANESRLSGTCACSLAGTLAGHGLVVVGTGGGSTGPLVDATSTVDRRWTRTLRFVCLAGVAVPTDGPCSASFWSEDGSNDDGDGAAVRFFWNFYLDGR